MPTCHDSRSVRCLLVALAIAGVALTSAQDRAGDPVATYRSFVQALDAASSLPDLFPYLAASVRDQLKEAPADVAPRVLQGLREDAAGRPPEWTVVEQVIASERARLVLRGHRADDRTRVGLETQVELVREDDGWKIVEPPEPWRAVEMLPVDPGASTAAPPLGPGAADRGGSAEFDPAGYRPVAQAAVSGNGREGFIVFDPRGRYVALGYGSSGRLHLLEIGGLEERWSAQVPHADGTLSFRPDGRALALVSGSGWVPVVLPLAANVGQSPPERGYFFSTPILTEATAAIEGRPNWLSAAYHPTRPILALGVGDHENEDEGAIAFQPAGDGLWIPGPREPPVVWRATGSPWSLSWAPGGERLAWMPLAREPGSPIHVKDYPQGGDTRALSRADFVPGRFVFGPGGRLLAAAGGVGDSMMVIVWDLETGAEVASLPGIARVVFAPDGQHLLAVRDMGGQIERGVADEILVWKLGATAPVHALPAFRSESSPHYVAALGLSPNGRFLVAVSDAGTVQLWDAGGGS
jgi:hypothetical protein